MRIIDITEDFVIPGTNIILEKGDAIEVLTEDAGASGSYAAMELLKGDFKNLFSGTEIYSFAESMGYTLSQNMDSNDLNFFLVGIEEGAKG